ncbi:imidazole glycerol phosphate synthase subunit HisH [Floccifex sp.]|uniref:imidazole glycerol phosphate synthase subunit HisH n=1 Tax=Floccifex sp. TaxID=2815810 RepID=UPI002A751B46|nr:imidazole glycerol phosphate synthase subunit HisH [Floccifex sp.]MDD7281549.1 imidazole glycerol phosphate synthase subunit HisH [Erysipelotrichaceae bacterium]MDY2957510.1 imidazole glycerol phosphate synthase subunit HisH [Floccifex sp.]
MIGIIDYGMGNLYSVYNALNHIQAPCIITNSKEELEKCEKWILPGVGALPDCISNLKELGLFDYIKEKVQMGKPLLGICLGMQALFEYSMENKYCEGFGFIKGHIELMKDDSVRIPHIGWNLLEKNQDNALFDYLECEPYVYYVHSYFAQDYNEDDLLGYSMYGNLKICGLVQHENVLGAQFHPEKSAENGLKILKYFVEEFV